MRVEGSVTAISWIPSEAVEGAVAKSGTRFGVAGHDRAPPADLGSDIQASLDQLNGADRFRFANHLRGFVDFDEAGTVTSYGQQGSGWIGRTSVGGRAEVGLGATAMPELRSDPEVGDGWVRFSQTWGGRANAPMLRVVRRAPFVRLRPPVAWTTLQLTVHADGRCDGRLVGASPFPRHWLYDAGGLLSAKSGTTDWKRWASEAIEKHTPWGDEDSPAFVTAVETALERKLSDLIMRGATPPEVRRLGPGDALLRQGDAGDELFLVIDGVLVVDVDGNEIAEVGPGAVLGERAVLEGGVRTATITATTAVKFVAVPAATVDRQHLVELASGRRREIVATSA